MKYLNKLVLSAAIAVAGVTGSLQADTFTFSYKMTAHTAEGAGGEFHGTLEGDQIADIWGGHVENITVTSLFAVQYDLDGTILLDSEITGPFFVTDGELNSGAAVVSFDLDHNNFIFSRDDLSDPETTDYTGYAFLLGSWGTQGAAWLTDYANGNPTVFLVNASDEANGEWELINLDAPVSVPESGATIGLLGLALVGFAALRRKQSVR